MNTGDNNGARGGSLYTHGNNSQANVTLKDISLKPIPFEEKAEEDVSKRVGLASAITTIMSLMIGSGIFGSVGRIQEHVGSVGLALVIWVVCGGLALCGALCYAELGTALPGNGGETLYLQYGLGEWASFLFEWTSIVLMRPACLSWLMQSFSTHALRAFDALAESSVKHYESTLWILVVAFATCLLMTAASCASVKVSERVCGVLTYAKILALAGIISVGIGYGIRHPATLKDNFSSPFSPRTDAAKGKSTAFWSTTMSFMLAMNHGLWAMDGWNNLNLIAGRVSRPAKTLPMAIWSSILAVMSLYLATIFGYYAVLPSATVATESNIGIVFGHTIGGKWGSAVMAVLVMASTFSSGLSSLLTTSEIMIAASAKGFLPARLGRINEATGATTVGYCAQCLMAMLILILGNLSGSQGYDNLMTMCTFPTWIFYILAVLVMCRLRWKQPDLPRPYRVWPTTPILFLAGCTVLIVSTVLAPTDWMYALASVGFLLFGLPIYLVIRSRRSSKFARK